MNNCYKDSWHKKLSENEDLRVWHNMHNPHVRTWYGNLQQYSKGVV